MVTGCPGDVTRVTNDRAMCHDMVTDVMMLTARCSHLYWGQPGPCRDPWPAPAQMRDTRQRGSWAEQRGTQCSAHYHTGLHYGSQGFWETSSTFIKILKIKKGFLTPCGNESSCWCLVTQTPVWSWGWSVHHCPSGQLSIRRQLGRSSGVTGLSSHNPSHWHTEL